MMIEAGAGAQHQGTVSVASEIGWKMPPTWPDSSRIGENEKVMKASSR